MNRQSYIVALDLGTSGCRACAVAADGSVVAQKSAPLAPLRPAEGCSEYEAKNLLRAQLSALHAVLDEIGPEHAAALAVASQRSTVVLWNKSTGEAVAPVLTWEDGRSVREAEEAPVSQEDVHSLTGLYKTPYFSAPKIAWCLKNVPAVRTALKEGRLAAAPLASYLIWRLTGGAVFASDSTLAQRTLLLDIHTQTWSGKLCRAFGIPTDILPQVLPSASDYGSYEYKGTHIPIFACAGDQQAAAYAAGLTPSSSAINYGTGAFYLHNAGAERKLLPGILSSLSVSVETGKSDTLLEGPVNAAGSVFMWLQAIGVSFEMSEADALCAASANPVYFLPALGGLGAPYWDFSVSPVIANFSPLTRKADMVAGAVRGVAFLLADIFYYLKQFGIESDAIRVSGGLSQLRSLVQFQSDILQKTLVTDDETEGTVLGVAKLAAQRAGWPADSWRKRAEGLKTEPELFGVEAQREYKKWRTFVEWCRSRPA